MAERRMFAKTIIDSDAFLEMPISARLLYYDLAMRADDDGFNNSPRKVMRTVGATTDDMNILIARKFIIPFENGVVVIKHWRIHNYIRKDTYKETNYKEEKALLECDENNAYRLTDTSRPRAVDGPSTQVRIGKDSIVQDNNIAASGDPEEPPKHKNIIADFETLWKLYPRKEGKKKAFDAYARAIKKGVSFETIKQGIENYCKHIEAKKIEAAYIKHGSTWFNGECWNDEYSNSQDKPAEPPQEANPGFDDWMNNFMKGEP